MFTEGEIAQLLIAGPLVLDDIRAPAGRVHGVLGGAAYAALAARHFAPTTLASVVGEDFPVAHLAVLSGVTQQIRRVAGPSFLWSGEHLPDGRTITRRNEPGATAGVPPPLEGAHPDVVLIGAFEPALQAVVRDGVRDARFIALDTMAWHIARDPATLLRLLALFHAVFLTREEARMLNHGVDRCADVARALALELLVLKGGREGVDVWNEGRELHMPAYPVRAIDPTGAGDAFAGAFLASLAAVDRIDASTLQLAAANGAAAASFAVEDFGTRALERASRDAIVRRAQRLLGAEALA